MPIPANINADVIRARRKRLYILVADGGYARLLKVVNDGRQRLEEVVSLERPSARQAARELTTDIQERSPRGSSPGSRTRQSSSTDYDPHAVEVERFVKRVSRRLDSERRRNGIDELVLIAAPKILGALRTQLSAPTRKVVAREVPLDLVHSDDQSILQAALEKPER